MKAIATTLVLLLAGCATNSQLPKGIHAQTSPSGDVIISMDDQRAIVVKQMAKGGQSVIVANLDGHLDILQLDDDGITPVSVTLSGSNTASTAITRQTTNGFIMVFDQDGDGIPNAKIHQDADRHTTERFRLRSIDWENVPIKHPTE